MRIMARKKEDVGTDSLSIGESGPALTGPTDEAQYPEGNVMHGTTNTEPAATNGTDPTMVAAEDVDETPADKFHRLATARTSRIIDGIRTLPALANKKVYDYHSDHPGKIFDTLEKELREARKDFARIQEDGAGRLRSFHL
jgi:hypothetical protein